MSESVIQTQGIHRLWRYTASLLLGVGTIGLIHYAKPELFFRNTTRPPAQTLKLSQQPAHEAPPQKPTSVRPLLPANFSPKLENALNNGIKRASVNSKEAEKTGIIEKSDIISTRVKLPPLAVRATLDRESDFGGRCKQIKEVSSANGPCQIIESTMLAWFSCYGPACLEVVVSLDAPAANEMAFLLRFVDWKKGKPVLRTAAYNDHYGGKPPVKLKDRILNLRGNHAVSIALMCAHFADEYQNMVTLLKPRLKEFFDADHLKLLGFDPDNPSKDISSDHEGFYFLLWGINLYDTGDLPNILKAPPGKPMMDILAGRRDQRKDKLKNNGLTLNATAKDAVQFVARVFHCTYLGHKKYNAERTTVLAMAPAENVAVAKPDTIKKLAKQGAKKGSAKIAREELHGAGREIASSAGRHMAASREKERERELKTKARTVNLVRTKTFEKRKKPLRLACR